MSVNEPEMETLLSELVRIDSVTPWLIAGGAGEAAVAAFMRDWLVSVDADIEVVLEEVEDGRPNLLATLKGTGGGRSLCFNAHSDTVGYANWADRAMEPRRDGDRLIGVGVADDKSSCAIGLFLLRELAARAAAGDRLRGDVTVACTIDEEGSSIGTMDMLKRHTWDGAIVLEPDGAGRIIVEHQGFGWIDITVHGKPAHGSAPEEGIDAIVRMAEIVRGLAALDATFAATPDPRNGRTVLHTGTIQGGTDYATYPATCKLGIEIGTQPGETLAARIADIEAIFTDVRTRYPDLVAEVSAAVDRDPFFAVGHESLLEAATIATRAVLGREPELIGLNAWTDAALMQDAGIPTIELGALGGGFHAPDEWVSVSECVQLVDICLQTTIEFCR
jgi:acetylornithine deacetylase/succinyl-diaminopimelate desuccinylase-like protein